MSMNENEDNKKEDNLIDNLKFTVPSYQTPLIELGKLKNQTGIIDSDLLKMKSLKLDELYASPDVLTLKGTISDSVGGSLKHQLAETQELISKSILNSSIVDLIKEQKVNIQNDLLPELNVFDDQGLTMLPKTSIVGDLKLNVSNYTSSFNGLSELRSQVGTVIDSSFLQKKTMIQDSISISPKPLSIKESIVNSMNFETKSIMDNWNSTFNSLKNSVIDFEKINPINLNIESLGIDSDVLLESSVSIKGIYDSAVNDIEYLYKRAAEGKVSDDHNFDDELTDKEFLEVFVRYCKQIGSLLNTLNNSIVWDVLQKIVVIHSIYTMLFGFGNDREINNIDNPEIAPIEDKTECDNVDDLPSEEDNYNRDIEENRRNIDINVGKRV